MDREVKEKQSQQHESRSFAYLANKSPEELLVEMQALVDSMDERSFDGELPSIVGRIQASILSPMSRFTSK